MTIDPIPPIGLAGDVPIGAAPAAATVGRSFEDFVANQLSDVNSQLMQASAEVQKLATGEAQNLHQVMLAMEESRIAFQLVLTFRNKVLEAYQEVMRMQV